MQTNDFILKRQCHRGRTEYVLYQYDGTTVLKRVDGPWIDEHDAKHRAIQRWTAVGTVHYETAPNVWTTLSADAEGNRG